MRAVCVFCCCFLCDTDAPSPQDPEHERSNRSSIASVDAEPSTTSLTASGRLGRGRGSRQSIYNLAGRRVPFHQEDRGGMTPSIVEGPGAFYVGIIDILQE